MKMKKCERKAGRQKAWAPTLSSSDRMLRAGAPPLLVDGCLCSSSKMRFRRFLHHILPR